MAWYRSGTATIVQGSAVVTGVDTNWMNQRAGWILWLTASGTFHEVVEIVSSTELTLAEPVAIAGASGLDYAIIPTQGLALSLSEKVGLLIDVFNNTRASWLEVYQDFSATTYQLWLDQGNTGTVGDFLDSLIGAQGNIGPNGDSAYQVWLDEGGTGTKADFLDAISNGAVALAEAARDAASTSATAAAGSATAAAASETAAGASETAAAGSEAAASTSATAAGGSETASAASATAAAASETAAAGSATDAANSAAAAANSETAAAASETAAGGSETASAASATAAAASETAAAGSATAAAGSATTAATSATAAEAAQALAEAAADDAAAASGVDLTPYARKADNLSGLANYTTARTNLGLGSSATLDVPASGDAASGEVVKGNDSRLSDARTPTTHSHTKSDITGFSDGDYATAAQGAKADSATQPADLPALQSSAKLFSIWIGA